jgi:hypothetical protein
MSDSLENQFADPATTELAELARSLANDPKTRRQFLQLVKAKNPNQPIPELDLEAQMHQFAKPALDRVAALEQKLLERTAEDNVFSKRQALKAKGYSDEEVSSIEKLMIEKQIGSHDTAAEFFRQQNTMASPTPSTFSQVQMPVQGKEIKAAGGIKRWAQTEAFKAIDDLKAGRVKLAS